MEVKSTSVVFVRFERPIGHWSISVVQCKVNEEIRGKPMLPLLPVQKDVSYIRVPRGFFSATSVQADMQRGCASNLLTGMALHPTWRGTSL